MVWCGVDEEKMEKDLTRVIAILATLDHPADLLEMGHGEEMVARLVDLREEDLGIADGALARHLDAVVDQNRKKKKESATCDVEKMSRDRGLTRRVEARALLLLLRGTPLPRRCASSPWRGCSGTRPGERRRCESADVVFD